MDELTVDVTSLRQQLSRMGEAVVNNYVAHFYEMTKYDDLSLYWRKVAYNEVFGRMAELHLQVDLTSVKEDSSQ